jgi:hypothetical protein
MKRWISTALGAIFLFVLPATVSAASHVSNPVSSSPNMVYKGTFTAVSPQQTTVYCSLFVGLTFQQERFYTIAEYQSLVSCNEPVDSIDVEATLQSSSSSSGPWSDVQTSSFECYNASSCSASGAVEVSPDWYRTHGSADIYFGPEYSPTAGFISGNSSSNYAYDPPQPHSGRRRT